MGRAVQQARLLCCSSSLQVLLKEMAKRTPCSIVPQDSPHKTSSYDVLQ